MTAFNVIRRIRVYHSVGNKARAFSTDGHDPELVISHRLRHLSGPYKKLFYRFCTYWIRWNVCQWYATTGYASYTGWPKNRHTILYVL